MSFIGVLSDSPQMLVYRYYATATQGQTSVTVRAYTAGQTDVWVNGVKFIEGEDFTALNGTVINFTVALNLDDKVEIKTYEAASVANRQTMVTYEFVASSAGQTFTGLDYTVGLVMVSRNGFSLPSGDYTAGDGATLTVPSAAIGDDVILHGFTTFEVANALTQAVADGRYVQPNTQPLFGPSTTQRHSYASQVSAQDASIQLVMERQGGYAGYAGIGADEGNALRVYDQNTTERAAITQEGYLKTPYQPAFYAMFDGGSANATITNYDSVHLNNGNNFNLTTGTFTVPLAGMYFFHADVMNTSGYFSWNLRVNGTVKSSYHHSCTYNGYNNTSGCMTLYLQANDAVTLYINQTAPYSSGNNPWSGFGGHLIG